MNDRPSLYILDAYSIIYQVFHAIPLMSGPAGQPTHAVFGIFRDILNLIRDRKPDYLAAAFDGGGPVFRSELFADYKANRSAMPDELRPQIPVIRRVFEGFRVPVLIHEGAEADDVIATLAVKGVERGLDVYICTSDKDARQLLNDHVFIYNLRKQKVLDAAGLRDGLGDRPRAGRRPPLADRRRRRQRPRRPRDRHQDRLAAAPAVRHARRPARQRRRRSPAPSGRRTCTSTPTPPAGPGP